MCRGTSGGMEHALIAQKLDELVYEALREDSRPSPLDGLVGVCDGMKVGLS